MSTGSLVGARRWALAAVVAGALVVGLAPTFVRWSDAGPVATGFWRMVIALPLLAVWAVATRRPASARAAPFLGRAEAAVAAVAGLSFAADLACWHSSVNLTTAANATLFVNFAPIVVAVAAWLLLGERVGVRFVLGLAVALAGAALLLGVSFESGGQRLAGDGLAFVAAVFYAGYIVANKRLRASTPVGPAMFWVTAFSCLGLFAIALARGEPLPPRSLRGWLALAGLATVCHVLGQGLVIYGLAHLPAAFTSLVLLLHPVSASVLAWLLLGEALGPQAILGGAMVLAGLVVAQRGALTRAP